MKIKTKYRLIFCGCLATTCSNNAVVPNRGAIYDTQERRELMRFSIYH